MRVSVTFRFLKAQTETYNSYIWKIIELFSEGSFSSNKL